MTNLRAAFTALVVALLALGWCGAAWTGVQGEAPAWAVRMDAPAIRTLALVVFVASLLLALVPERERSK